MAVPVTVGRETLRQQLVDLAVSNTVINEVYISSTQHPGEPDLVGVTVVGVERDFVVFSQPGSAGVSRIIVLMDAIVALDIGS